MEHSIRSSRGYDTFKSNTQLNIWHNVNEIKLTIGHRNDMDSGYTISLSGKEVDELIFLLNNFKNTL